jgi:uncharacterized protein (TIGR02246 family)
MKKILLAVAALLVSTSAFAADTTTSTTTKSTTKTTAAAPKGDDAIKAVFASVDAAMAKHDATAFVAVYSDDATYIAPMGDGTIIKGKADIQKAHEAMMANMKDATLTHTVNNVRWIGKNTAFADVTAVMTGGPAPAAGAPTPIWHGAMLLQAHGGKWLITDARPYAIMPMPAAPASN